MNVTAIASSPRTSTGPPFERLYAVEPDGVEQIIPSQGTVPRSSPPIAHASSTMRPSVELVTTTSLTAIVPLAVEPHLERRQLDRDVLAGEDALQVALEIRRPDRREEADAAEVDADHRHVAPEQPRERAQHRPVAAEHDREVGAARGSSTSVTPASLGDGPHPLDRALDVDVAVRDHRRGLNPRRLLCRFARRGHPEASGRRCV